MNELSKDNERDSIIMCKVCEVAKVVINKCLDCNYFINTQKLQKLLVLMQIESCCQNETPLFNEDVLIWTCGVAIKEVDDAFGEYSVSFEKKDRQIVYISLLDKYEVVIDQILNVYGDKSVAEINKSDKIQYLINKYTELNRKHIFSSDILNDFKIS